MNCQSSHGTTNQLQITLVTENCYANCLAIKLKNNYIICKVAGKLDLMTAWYHVSASNARKSDFLLQDVPVIPELWCSCQWAL